MKYLALFIFLLANPLFAADSLKKLAVEVDPMSPVSASISENSGGKNRAESWGASIEFNVGAKIATGPEYWIGTYKRQGTKTTDLDGRPEEMYSDEHHKIDASRLRWMVGLYEHSMSLRGWFVKGGFSYTKIIAKSDRKNRHSVAINGTTPTNIESNITELRQGVVGAIGQRWLMLDRKFSVSLAASYTYNFVRKVSVDSENPDARDDYEDVIDDLPGSKTSNRPLPEAYVYLGYMF